MDFDQLRQELSDLEAKLAKAEAALLTALCDIGSVWDVPQVTSALTGLADNVADSKCTIADYPDVIAKVKEIRDQIGYGVLARHATFPVWLR